MAVHDSMEVLSGKWKISIIAVLCYHKNRRFSDLLKDVEGISNRMLSKELKDLEMNKLVKRTVLDTHPVTVEYSPTEYSVELKTMIDNLADWGMKHRKKLFG
ncbi:MAG TPA: helix-turn-helix domain-containing protein [Sphingobacterium sp.]|nr:helix-turn-helix domain-containing protein [Sphingobacterium sp.]